MSIIRLNAQNCQNCYKCIRECPLKAIEFKDGTAKIIQEECVLCGNCVETCPQGAKYIRKNDKAVKLLLSGDKPVCISIAPSYSGWYVGKSFRAVSAALKKLGFFKVEETAIGAAEVTKEYADLMETGQMKQIIATSCSSAVMLIERHYPQLLKLLAPVSSPMMAHAKLMREAYGDIKVVFVGPCLSKMHEADDPLAGGMVNEVITFQELDEWLEAAGIEIAEEDNEATGLAEPISRIYPKQEGIITTLGQDRLHGYTPISVDGMDRCIELFEELMVNKSDKPLFIEANVCAGSCIGGPVMRSQRKSVINSTVNLTTGKLELDDVISPTAKLNFTHPRVFANRSVKNVVPTEMQVAEILARTGKLTKDDELNCGSCGYATCREKAAAVFNGKADITMCMPFLRERAENMSAMVIENSPNGIITFDEDTFVTEINPKAERLFGVTRGGIIGQMIPSLYGETAFDDAISTGKIISKKCQGHTEEIFIELTVVYLKQNHMFIAFAKDISEQEQNKEELEGLRLSTVDIAQNVINKQMRVAQEIASLLGETTAETKVALTKLKSSIKDISNSDI